VDPPRAPGVFVAAKAMVQDREKDSDQAEVKVVEAKSSQAGMVWNPAPHELANPIL